MVGGCSDSRLRIWDLDSTEVMCSSPYIQQESDDPQVAHVSRDTSEDEILRHLTGIVGHLDCNLTA
jgi:hypothetical protein